MKKNDGDLIIYNKVAEQAHRLMRGYIQGDNNLLEGYKSLKSHFSKHNESINYEIYSIPFSYAFFLENFWKTILMLEADPPPVARTLLDIGTGSGACTLGYLAWLDHHIKPNVWSINITFVDRSSKQLEFLKNLLANFDFQNIKIEANFVLDDFTSWAKEYDKFDLVLLGHVLNENLSNLNTLLTKAENITLPNGKIYILERYNDDTTWQLINESLSSLALNSKRSRVSIQLNRIFVGDSPHLSRKKEIKIDYVSVQVPSNKNFNNLIRKYFEAWSKKSINLLEQVFSEDAEYEEKPFEVTYKGLSEIKNYWREKVFPQEKITIDILRITYTGSIAIIKWQAEFILPDAKLKQVRGIIELTYDCQRNKISRLEEYFRTKSSIPWTSVPDKAVPDYVRKQDII